MAQHVRILAWLFVAWGVILLVVGLIIGFFVAGGGLLSGDRTAMFVTGSVAALVVGVLVVLSLPNFFTAWGLLRFRPWARVLAIILSVLHILSFPLGTALAIYTLWVLLNRDTQPLFDRPLAAAA